LSSLSAFVAAGLWPRTPLAKAIVLVLVVKLIGITAVRIYMADRAAPAVDANTMARVFGLSSAEH
jgi:hypothetical protein